MKRLVLLLLLCLSGCMVGPNFQRPTLCMPTHFIEAIPDKTDSLVDEDFFQWWHIFEDPFLNQLLEEALCGNFDIQIALTRICQARAQFDIQTSQLFPEIDLEGIATRYRISRTIFDAPLFGPAIQNFFEQTFTVIWELDLWGKFRRAQKSAGYQWLASAEEARAVQISVLSEVAIDYVFVCALQKRLSIARQKIQYMQELLTLGTTRFTAGLSNDQQVETLRATLESDQAALQLLEIAYAQGIYALSTLLGKQPELFVCDFEAGHPIPKAMGRVPAGLPCDLLRRRPDIRHAEFLLASATEQIGVAVADIFPHVSLTGNYYGFQTAHFTEWFTNPSTIWNIGPYLSLPLIDFGKRFAVIEGAKCTQSEACYAYQKTVVSALQETESALVAYFKEEERLKHLSKQVEANKTVWQLNLDLFNAGLIDYSEVLQTVEIYLTSEDTLTQSEQALTTHLITLYKALGGDW